MFGLLASKTFDETNQERVAMLAECALAAQGAFFARGKTAKGCWQRSSSRTIGQGQPADRRSQEETQRVKGQVYLQEVREERPSGNQRGRSPNLMLTVLRLHLESGAADRMQARAAER